MADDLEQGLPPDLSDPNNWSGNSIERSLADAEAAIEEEEPPPEKPGLPAPPPDADLEALRRENAALREGLQVRSRIEAERQPAPAPAQQPPVQDLTEAQWEEMLQTQPARAMALMASRIADARAQNIDTRISTMLRASTAIVEQQVAARHADMFTDYGDEIRQVVSQFAPENQVDPGAWDTAVQLVRGRHMDDIIAKRVQAELAKAGEAARATQAASAGFSGSGRRGTSTAAPMRQPDNTYGLSPEQQKVAKEMGLSLKEYAKYV